MKNLKRIPMIILFVLFLQCSSKSSTNNLALFSLGYLMTQSMATVSTLTLVESGKDSRLILNQPEDIAVGNDGNLYIADSKNNRIVSITSESTVKEIIPSTGNGTTVTSISNPEGITAGSGNLIYIANTSKNNIISYDTSNGTISLVSGVNNSSSSSTTDGTPGNYFKPEGIRFNASLNKLYVGENGGFNIREVNTTTGAVTTLVGARGSATPTAGTPLASDGPVTVPSNVFNSPTGVVSDSKGIIFIVDKGNHCIRKFDSKSNTISTFAGSRIGGDDGAGYIEGSGTSAKFNTPYMIAIDESDNLYVADSKNYAIRKITPAGVVSTIAGGRGQGRADGTISSFYNPIGIYYKNKVLYVTDKASKALATADTSVDYSTVRKLTNF